MKRKKKIILISIVGAVVIIATVFIILALTIWKTKPKTTQDWLNDFKASLVIQKEGDWQAREKNIEIYEDELLVASYFMEYKVNQSSENSIAYFKSEEIYYTLGTTEFDIYDEYYFADGVLYIRRISGEEEIKTSYGATINEFWSVIENGIGKSEYDFSESNFNKLEINHENDLHSMNAKLHDDKKAAFFANEMDVSGLYNVAISVSVDNSLKLSDFSIFYNTVRQLDTGIEDDVAEQTTSIYTKSILKHDIIKPDWV